MISCLNTAALFVGKRITKILLMAPFFINVCVSLLNHAAYTRKIVKETIK